MDGTAMNRDSPLDVEVQRISAWIGDAATAASRTGETRKAIKLGELRDRWDAVCVEAIQKDGPALNKLMKVKRLYEEKAGAGDRQLTDALGLEMVGILG
jgi:hypothetical protein